MRKEDFKNGQKVFLRIIPGSKAGDRIGVRDNDDPKQVVEATVVSVGRKYITVERECSEFLEGISKGTAKFEITQGSISTNCNYEIFLTRKDAEDSIKADKIYGSLRHNFTGYSNKEFNLRQMEQINAVIHGTGAPLSATVYTDVLIEVAMVARDYVDSVDPCNKLLVDIANEYVANMANAPATVIHSRRIDSYVKMRLIEDRKRRGIIDTKPWYFTFGSDYRFPYQNTYMVVYAKDESSAIEKYRKKYPDRHEGVVNCAFWYSEEKWKGSECEKVFDSIPAEVMW